MARWAALAPVTLPVLCGDQNHELHWGEGSLVAPAHPNADRERVLAALGAEPSPCVEILDAWNRHTDDLDVLVLASRGPGDRLEESESFASHGPAPGPFRTHGPPSRAARAHASMVHARPGSFGWSAYSPMPMRYVEPNGGGARYELARLLSLGANLPQRLAASVIGTWAERIEVGDERVAAATPALDAALYGRLQATLLAWLGNPARVEFTMQPPGAEPALRREGDVINVELPFAWLRDVWVNELAVIVDRFCVRALHTPPAVWTLTTVDRTLTGPRTVTISG